MLDQTPFDNTALTINSVNNYSYTEIGERKSNKQDSIDLVIWTVYGKIKEIYRTPGSTKKNIKFDYDASGNRIAKHVFNSDSTWVRSEYYIRDAQGNIMSTYQHNIDSTMHYAQTEKHIYGSSMLGIDTKETEMIGAVAVQDGDVAEHALGYKHFTGNNHLGNVLTTFTDRKIPVDLNTDNLIDEYWPDVVAANDYYPFGVKMKERSFSSENTRYQFNGKQFDEETETNDFGARMLDGDLGIWGAVDKNAHNYPQTSPYNYSLNNPIFFIDKDGNIVFDKDGNEVKMYIKKGELVITNAESIDPKLVTLLKDTYNESKVGKATIENLNSDEVKIQVIVSDKVGVLQVNDENGNPHYGIVQGLTVPAQSPSDKYDAKLTIYEPTDGSQVVPQEGTFEVTDATGKVVPQDEIKQLKNFDQDHFDAKTQSKATQSGLKKLSDKEQATLDKIRKEGAINKAFGRVSTLIHETIHAVIGDLTENATYKAEIKSYEQKNKSKEKGK